MPPGRWSARRRSSRRSHSLRALAGKDGKPGLLVEQVVLDRLGLHTGDTVRLGNASFILSRRRD